MNARTTLFLSIFTIFTILLSGCGLNSPEAAETSEVDETDIVLESTATLESSTPAQTPKAASTAPATETVIPTTTAVPANTSTPIVMEYTLDLNEVIASGLNRPVSITHAGDGSGRLFVAEQGGKIVIIQDGIVLAEPFLDLRGTVSGGSEQGLLGLAFHPDYESNGFFFVDFTDLQGNTQIVRYQVSLQPDVANPSSAVTLLSVTQPYANHNGGQIAFGPDGYLYIALGDGGSANDPQNNAQNLTSPLGTILRIHVQDDGSYLIPPNNPFVGQQQVDERIWAWGLRNPWRFSFDRQTGDLYIADVGQNQWEEINFQPADSSGGLNYGWRCLEGQHNHDNQAPCDNSGYTAQFVAPIAEYSHQEGQSVTGGYVYRGATFSGLLGIYFYADFSSGRIWSVRLSNRQDQVWTEPRLELESGMNISSFGEDEYGEIYIADYFGGTIRHLRVE